MSTYFEEDEELGSASHDLSLVLLRQTPSCSAALFPKFPYLLCHYVRLYTVFLCHLRAAVGVALQTDGTHPRFDI